MTNSLQSLLDYEGSDVEDVFSLAFEITREVYGELRVIPLKPNGSNIPVTQENKYVLVILMSKIDRSLFKLVLLLFFSSFSGNYHLNICFFWKVTPK